MNFEIDEYLNVTLYLVASADHDSVQLQYSYVLEIIKLLSTTCNSTAFIIMKISFQEPQLSCSCLFLFQKCSADSFLICYEFPPSVNSDISYYLCSFNQFYLLLFYFGFCFSFVFRSYKKKMRKLATTLPETEKVCNKRSFL